MSNDPHLAGHRPPAHWNQAMLAQASAALDRTILEFKGDRERLYLMGVSMGGRGGWSLAAHDPRRFAAAVFVASAVTVYSRNYPEQDRQLDFAENDYLKADDAYSALAAKVAHLPIWLFHGTKDDVSPVDESRKMKAALEHRSGNVRFTEYPDRTHNSWDSAFTEGELMPWLLAQQRR